MTPKPEGCCFANADIRISPDYLENCEILHKESNPITTEECFYCRCQTCGVRFQVSAHHGYHFPQYFYPARPCSSNNGNEQPVS